MPKPMPRLPHLPLALVGAALLAAGCGESVPGPQDLASGTQYDFRLLRDGAAGSDDGGDGDGGAPLGDGGAIVEDGAALGDGGLAIDGLELFPDLPLGDAPPPADGPSESPDQAPEDLVADDGPACMGGGDCAVANQPCRKGLWTCLNGQRVCQDTGVNLQNGSACGMNQVCSGGTCVPCEAGKACNPPNVCHLGQIACDSGQPTCVDTAPTQVVVRRRP